MKIVLVQLFDLPSSMAHAIQILSTACALAERGHSVVLHPRVARGTDAEGCTRELLGRDLPAGLSIEPIGFRHKGLAGLEYRRRLAAHLRADDGATVFYARQRRQTLALASLRKLLRRRSPIAYELHNLEHVLAEEAGDRARARTILAEERRVAREADLLVAISRPLAEDAVTVLAPRGRIEVVPDGVDLARFRGIARPFERSGGAKGRARSVRAVYAGSLYPHKGVESLLETLRELPPEVLLTIVGGTPPAELERLRARARELFPDANADVAAPDARVTFAGQKDPAGVAEELSRADVVLLPSAEDARAQRYTSPLKLFEAMATGAPIVAAPAPAFTSVLADGRTAFVAASGAPRDLAACVERVLADPKAACSVGRAAMADAEAYGWEKRAQRIEELFLALGRGVASRGRAEVKSD